MEAMCLVWTLETLAYYLKGCRHFDLWADHNPRAQALRFEVLARAIQNTVVRSIELQ